MLNITKSNLKAGALILLAVSVCVAVQSCRNDDPVIPFTPTPVQDPAIPTPDQDGYLLHGFYLLNQGNMGMNKSTLDYLDYATGVYNLNIYASANPNVPMELGDVGNDLAIYGSKMWAVINCSNKVEVMRASDAVRLGQVEIANCRYITFHKGYAYVTSYAGPVEINPDYKQRGYVAKIDTATLQIVARCDVGFQPDGIAISGNKIYVANSGGYMAPNYDHTMSVISLDSFTVTETIGVVPNLHNILVDKRGDLWISTRGDYYDNKSKLYCYSPGAHAVIDSIDVPVSAMTQCGDSLYIVSTEWNYVTMSNNVTNAIINTAIRQKVSDSFITDGTQSKIKVPYGVAVNPVTKEIYVTDAGNYVNPGWLYCFTPEGVMRWRVRTGDIPSKIAFYATIEK